MSGFNISLEKIIKIINNKNSNIFFTSDLHFFHSKILSLREQFYDVNQMNNELISLWNNKVSKNDVVFYLGDFSFGKQNDTIEILKKLNGHIIFICGNHDYKFKRGDYDNYLAYKCDIFEHSLPIKIKNENGTFDIIDNNHFVMCHFPIFEWNKMHYGSVHLYGHVHAKNLDDVLGGRAINVTYDFNHAILSIEDIYNKFKDVLTFRSHH